MDRLCPVQEKVKQTVSEGVNSLLWVLVSLGAPEPNCFFSSSSEMQMCLGRVCKVLKIAQQDFEPGYSKNTGCICLDCFGQLSIMNTLHS